MCTAIAYKTKDFYFGRTLDYEFSYVEEVTVMPRNFPFPMRHTSCMDEHYAVIGMACVKEGIPLFYDGVNEKGLAMAGLNFVGNAVYGGVITGKRNVAQFELIAWILGTCASVSEAKKQLLQIQVTATPFSCDLPVSQLHWLIADENEAITVEYVAEGLKIYDNPVGVLTNNPSFDMQMQRLKDFMHISARTPNNSFSRNLQLLPYSRGMGGLGLPGDLSSQSRFVRAAFVKENAVSGVSEPESVNQFFHILGSVEQPRGCCEVAPGEYEITIYSACCNANKGVYYYTTYGNHQISAVDMHREDLDGTQLSRYPLVNGEQIQFVN